MNKQAEELNRALPEATLSMLSKKGKEIYFPKEGIVAQSAEAKGRRINATIGSANEDDGNPMRLSSVQDMIKLSPKDAFPYASSFGVQKLREKWREMIYRKNPSLKAEVSMPVVTCALTHGISVAGYLFLDPGDAIVSPDRFWGNYRLTLEHAYGGAIQTFRTFSEGGFDVAAMKEKLASISGRKMLILNFPNNPTGYTPTVEEADGIRDALLSLAEEGHRIVVLCDDAYFGLVYEEGIYTESLFSKLADLHENILAVKLDGATKEDYAWGLRVGFLTFGGKGLGKDSLRALEQKSGGIVRGSISNAPHISQSLLLHALASPGYEEEKQEKVVVLRRRYEKIKEIMSSGRFRPLPFNSGYFMCIEIDADAEKVRKILLEKYDTGVISLGKLIRIAFSSVAENDLPELFDNIEKACEEAR